MIHIFLCDDDSSYLEYLSEIVDGFFRQNNIEAGIKTFTDGEKLLEEPEMADIVFLDVEMPGKSGIEVEDQREKSICTDLHCIIYGTVSG